MTTQSNLQPKAPTPLSDTELELTLQKAKVRLFAKKGAGFLGSLLCNHDIFFDDTCPTAYCDGKVIGISPLFWARLNRDTRVTLLAHELWHTGFEHMSRLGDRYPELWNQAADHVINLLLEENGYVFTDMHPLKDGRFKNMTTEAVYEIIKKEEEAAGKSPDGSKPLPGIGDPLTESQQGLPGMQGDLRAPGSEEAKHEIFRKNVQAVQVAQLSNEAGTIPGEIKETIDKFLNPVLPWNQILYRYFSDLSKDDYSWRRPSRRYSDEYLPSLIGENGLEHLTYYLDVSGSISTAQLTRFHSEVRHIHQDLRPRKLTVVTFDTIIQEIVEYELDDTYDEFEVVGRGGTCLKPVYDHIVKERPTAAIIFSDMYVPKMEKNPGVPVIWVIMDNKNAEVDFGTKIHLSKKDLK